MHDISKVMLVTDLDGTLLPHSKVISETDLKAIKSFREKGGIFTVATGRTIQSAQCYIDRLELDVPLIMYNGAMIYNPVSREILFKRTLGADAKALVKKILDKFQFVGCEILRPDGMYVVRNNEYEKSHIEVCGVTPFYCDIDELDTDEWLKVLFAMNPDKSDEVWEYVSSLENAKDFVRSSYMFIELLPENVSKGEALKELRKLSGIGDDGIIIAAGDYNNDIEMLEYADIGFAPSNACDEVKKSADYISEKSCEENALSDAVEYIFTEVI
ncbi:MAG: Cof-type HAD-IIB family hydrolase [Oscillospiraceae bacterium]